MKRILTMLINFFVIPVLISSGLKIKLRIYSSRVSIVISSHTKPVYIISVPLAKILIRELINIRTSGHVGDG